MSVIRVNISYDRIHQAVVTPVSVDIFWKKYEVTVSN
jgi:hypothetical protein